MGYHDAQATAAVILADADQDGAAHLNGIAIEITQVGYYSINDGPALRRHQAINRVASLLVASATSRRIRKSLDLQADDWPALDEAARQAGATGWRNLLLRIARGEIVCSPR